MGRVRYEWQDRNYVLSRFGKGEKAARTGYHEFVNAGIAEGRKPKLVGGGLIRSLGGWSEVASMRRRRERELSDERILGSGSFVENVLREEEESVKEQMSPWIAIKDDILCN